MKEKLDEIFESIGLPFSLQGSYQEGESLPISFFTYWNIDTPEDFFYDNEANRTQWKWYVYFYTSDPSVIYSQMDEFVRLAKEKGFIVEGRGNDIPSDVPDYLGRYVRVTYLENY